MPQILDPRDNFIYPHDPLKSRNFLIHAAQGTLEPKHKWNPRNQHTHTTHEI